MILAVRILRHISVIMSCPQKNNKCKTGNDNICACIAMLKSKLQQIEKQRCILEEKLAKHNQTKAEVADLENQLDNLKQSIDNMTVNREKCYESLSQEMDRITSKYDQVIGAIHQLKEDNNELQCNINTKAAEDLQIVNNIKELETIKTKTSECVNEVKDKIRCEQVT